MRVSEVLSMGGGGGLNNMKNDYNSSNGTSHDHGNGDSGRREGLGALLGTVGGDSQELFRPLGFRV